MSGARERPILFSAPMVRAILGGRKAVTRRIVRDQDCVEEMDGPLFIHSRKCGSYCDYGCGGVALDSDGVADASPFGVPGDRLWVRETWAPADEMAGGYELEDPVTVAYRADLTARICVDEPRAADTYAWNWDALKWKPSIFMPRWASRITLEVTGVRVERLQEITEEDARAEGAASPIIDGSARDSFMHLWEQINGKRAPWSANPWVWRVEFRRLP